MLRDMRYEMRGARSECAVPSVGRRLWWPSALRPPPSALTLIELLVVIVILMTLVGGVIPVLSPNNDARKIREAVECSLVLVGGLRRRAQLQALVAEGFELVAMARPLIMEPDLVRRMERGETDASRCEPCNLCVAEMNDNHTGMRCPKIVSRTHRTHAVDMRPGK